MAIIKILCLDFEAGAETQEDMKDVLALDLGIALVLCALRIGGVRHIAFQAAAHVFMGYLGRRIYDERNYGPWYLAPRFELFVLLCVVEVVCVFYQGLTP